MSPQLVSAFLHFVYKKFHTGGKVIASCVAKCLGGMGEIRAVGDILKEMRLFSHDASFRTVYHDNGRVALVFPPLRFNNDDDATGSENPTQDRQRQQQSAHLDVVTFRLLLIYHFVRYVMSSPVLLRRVKPGERWFQVQQELRRGQVPAKVSWNKIIPTYAVTDNAKIRKMFQSTKRDQSLTFTENVIVQKIAAVMRSYTLESPLALLQAVFPGVDLTVGGQRVLWQEDARYPPETVNLDTVVYYSLNTYINWVVLNVHSVVNTGVRLSARAARRKRRTAEPYNVFCSVCFRTFTFRTKQRRDNPKHSDMIYCTDTHTSVSSCCNASLKHNSSLGTLDTVLLFKNGHHQYRADDDSQPQPQQPSSSFPSLSVE